MVNFSKGPNRNKWSYYVTLYNKNCHYRDFRFTFFSYQNCQEMKGPLVIDNFSHKTVLIINNLPGKTLTRKFFFNYRNSSNFFLRVCMASKTCQYSVNQSSQNFIFGYLSMTAGQIWSKKSKLSP